MGYWLGIDVGSTVTAAAVWRDGGPAEVVALGSGSAVLASVVYLGADGQVVVGDAAQARAATDPDRVVRGFTGRIGDEVPMVIGGQAYTAAQITAMVVAWVVDRVAAQQGGRTQGIVLTHPAGWGGYKREVLVAALAAAGLGQVQLWPSAVAAAAGYAARQPIAPGHCIAVYDLGGATFEAAVVGTTDAGELSVLGPPQSLDQLGGADFDDAVFGHVLAAVPSLAELDADDPATLAATAALRRECTRAKEALSADTEATIPVIAPGIHTSVRLHRAEFDDMIRSQLSETVQALRRTLNSTHLQPHQLDAMLLVGGSSRIPLVAQLVSTDLDQPITVGADPDTAAALGAAALAAPASQVDNVPEAQPAPEPPIRHLTVPPEPTFSPQQPERPSLTAIPLDVEPTDVQRRRTNSRRVKRAALASGLAVLTAAAVASVPFLVARSAANPPANAGIPPPSTSPAPDTSAAGTPPVPNPTGAIPSAGTGGEVDSGASGTGGVVRTTSPAAPNHVAGAPGKPDPAGAPASAPASSWVTTYTWTTSWSSPPPTTTRPAPTTATAPLTTPSKPAATTTQPPPRTTTTTASAPTTKPSH